jgi:hypothetical protein
MSVYSGFDRVDWEGMEDVDRRACRAMRMQTSKGTQERVSRRRKNRRAGIGAVAAPGPVRLDAVLVQPWTAHRQLPVRQSDARHSCGRKGVTKK